MKNASRGPRLIHLGLIGVCDDFHEVYLPIFLKYVHRIQITQIFDPLSSRARATAPLTQSSTTCSLLRAIKQPQVDGIICLRSGWYQPQLAQLAQAAGKPLLDFVGRDVSHAKSPAVWHAVTPALLTRYQPAMMRLRELMSTQLGYAEGIELMISPEQSDAHEELTGRLDWGLTLLGRDVQGVVPNLDGSLAAISIQRTRPVAGMVELVVHRTSPSESLLIARLVCQKGRVDIRSEREITWNITGGEAKTELLEDERRPEEVIIDHFCRRLAGGLIPIPEWKDRIQATTLATHVLECLTPRA